MTIGEIVDKIWAEHDHDHDDNYIYAEGWTDACDRFNQELCNKSIVEWHKVEDELPKDGEMVLVYGYFRYYMINGVKSTMEIPAPVEFYSYAMYFDGDGIFINPTGPEGKVYNTKDEVVAWAYMPKYEGGLK